MEIQLLAINLLCNISKIDPLGPILKYLDFSVISTSKEKRKAFLSTLSLSDGN